MMELFVCEHCGKTLTEENSILVDDDFLCESCATELTSCCSRCGRRIYNSDNAGDEDLVLCQSCYDYYYTTCERCGRIIHGDDTYYLDDEGEDALCYDCYMQGDQARPIHNYYYKPTPIFYGKGPRFLGVELEIDGGGEKKSSANSLLRISQREGRELMFCKHDGSLDDGFEMVSHPMTLDYHKENMPWKEILECCVTLGYQSHQARTCGLHVHVSRAAFGETEKQQDACIARILYFFEKHWEEMLKFSRRTQTQLERWAARYGYKEQPMEILDHAKTGYHGGRYTCVNLQNADTIEFRMFRGTLKYNTFIATLQMVNRICDVALFMSDEELKAMSWTTFVAGCKEPELIQYLKERRLYVNEPVESEVEL